MVVRQYSCTQPACHSPNVPCCCSKDREEEDTELRPVYITPLTSTDGADLTISRLCFDFRDATYSQFMAGSGDGLLACLKLVTTEVCPASCSSLSVGACQ